MATAMPRNIDTSRTYVQLIDRGRVLPVEVGGDFWQHGIQQHNEGRLVFAYHFEKDADHWEQHPQGDELAYVLSGAIDFVLEEQDREHVVELRAGLGCIVPRGTWHRQVVRTPGDVLFITPGKGTRHRPVSPR